MVTNLSEKLITNWLHLQKPYRNCRHFISRWLQNLGKKRINSQHWTGSVMNYISNIASFTFSSLLVMFIIALKLVVSIKLLLYELFRKSSTSTAFSSSFWFFSIAFSSLVAGNKKNQNGQYPQTSVHNNVTAPEHRKKILFVFIHKNRCSYSYLNYGIMFILFNVFPHSIPMKCIKYSMAVLMHRW